MGFSAGWIVKDFTLFLILHQVHSNKTQEENDPDYGETWMYFPDDLGQPLEANLSKATLNDNSKTTFSRDDNIIFYLYTRRNLRNPQQLNLEDIETSGDTGEYFDPRSDTKILIHGWRSSGNITSITDIKDAYLEDRNANVVVLDWSELASNMLYFIAARDTALVGRKTASLIDLLVTRRGMSYDQFHVVGHSLGAHVAGSVGHYVQHGKIARITGLDPAKPGFENVVVTEHVLQRDDGKFVDVIHTATGLVGYSRPLGTVDFYPNGGSPPQPGCEGIQRMLDGCSHARAPIFFRDSILHPYGFPSTLCRNDEEINIENCGDPKGGLRHMKAYMGDHVSTDISGVYYTVTNEEEPFYNEP